MVALTSLGSESLVIARSGDCHAHGLDNGLYGTADKKLDISLAYPHVQACLRRVHGCVFACVCVWMPLRCIVRIVRIVRVVRSVCTWRGNRFDIVFMIVDSTRACQMKGTGS